MIINEKYIKNSTIFIFRKTEKFKDSMLVHIYIYLIILTIIIKTYMKELYNKYICHKIILNIMIVTSL